MVALRQQMPLLAVAVAGATGLMSWTMTQNLAALAITLASVVPFLAVGLWTRFQDVDAPNASLAMPDVMGPQAFAPDDVPETDKADPHNAASVPAAQAHDAAAIVWETFLPDLMAVLEALAQHVIEDTNRSSIEVMTQLMSVESAVIALNRRQGDALQDLENIDRTAAEYHSARDVLTADIAAAMASGREVIDEVNASRTALAGVEGSIREMQRELGAISKISKEINILSINATIEASRAGTDGAGFSVIARSIRALSDETECLTRRLGPLIAGARSELNGYADQRKATAGSGRDVAQILTEQGDVLEAVAAKFALLNRDFASIIVDKRSEILASLNAGADVEAAIRSILANAQFADIIRQQVEALAGGLLAIREAASGGAKSWDSLAGLLKQLEDSYVMENQRDAHRHGLQAKADPANGARAAASRTEPSMELF